MNKSSYHSRRTALISICYYTDSKHVLSKSLKMCITLLIFCWKQPIYPFLSTPLSSVTQHLVMRSFFILLNFTNNYNTSHTSWRQLLGPYPSLSVWLESRIGTVLKEISKRWAIAISLFISGVDRSSWRIGPTVNVILDTEIIEFILNQHTCTGVYQ